MAVAHTAPSIPVQIRVPWGSGSGISVGSPPSSRGSPVYSVKQTPTAGVLVSQRFARLAHPKPTCSPEPALTATPTASTSASQRCLSTAFRSLRRRLFCFAAVLMCLSLGTISVGLFSGSVLGVAWRQAAGKPAPLHLTAVVYPDGGSVAQQGRLFRDLQSQSWLNPWLQLSVLWVNPAPGSWVERALLQEVGWHAVYVEEEDVLPVLHTAVRLAAAAEARQAAAWVVLGDTLRLADKFSGLVFRALFQTPPMDPDVGVYESTAPVPRPELHLLQAGQQVLSLGHGLPAWAISPAVVRGLELGAAPCHTTESAHGNATAVALALDRCAVSGPAVTPSVASLPQALVCRAQPRGAPHNTNSTAEELEALPDLPDHAAARDFMDGPAAYSALCGTSAVVGGVATTRNRLPLLRQVLADLAGQVDLMYLYLNGLSSPPAWLQSPEWDWVHPIPSEGTHPLAVGDAGDAGKFAGVDWVPTGAFFATVDDDLRYPPHYLRSLASASAAYGDTAAVAFHGYSVVSPSWSYLSARALNVRLLGSSGMDMPMHVGGTGAMAFRRSAAVPVTFTDFRARNMADLWMASVLQRHRVPLVTLAHGQGFVTHQPLQSVGVKTIWDAFDGAETPLQDAILQGHAWLAHSPMCEPVPARPTVWHMQQAGGQDRLRAVQAVHDARGANSVALSEMLGRSRGALAERVTGVMRALSLHAPPSSAAPTLGTMALLVDSDAAGRPVGSSSLGFRNEGLWDEALRLLQRGLHLATHAADVSSIVCPEENATAACWHPARDEEGGIAFHKLQGGPEGEPVELAPSYAGLVAFFHDSMPSVGRREFEFLLTEMQPQALAVLSIASLQRGACCVLQCDARRRWRVNTAAWSKDACEGGEDLAGHAAVALMVHKGWRVVDVLSHFTLLEQQSFDVLVLQGPKAREAASTPSPPEKTKHAKR